MNPVTTNTDLPWSLDEAFQYCRRVTDRHYENFPVASMFIPADKRKHVTALYAFARTADDFADEEGYTSAERVEKLTDWERALDDCYMGNARHPVFIALRETVRSYKIPKDLFQRLLRAFKSDVTTHRYETFDEVLRYCRNSANPVGRLVLLLFGYRDQVLFELSDHICTALQLTNFWQDVTVDLDKDRVYLPLEDLRRFGLSEGQLFERTCSPEFRRLLEFEVSRTKGFFQKGQPLLGEVGKVLSFELKLTLHGGMRILSKIEHAEMDVFSRRPILNVVDKAAVLARALIS